MKATAEEVAMRILISVFLTLVAIAVLGTAMLYSGAISFAADEPHSQVVFELIERAREHSIEARVGNVEARALDDVELLERGAEDYASMCEACHLAPGMDDTELRRGLYPQPPNLVSHEHDQGDGDQYEDSARQFWIVKHGLKATAMPAWGVTHDDDAIWGIVAFLQRLPELSQAQYEELTARAPRSGESNYGGDAEPGSHEHAEEAGAQGHASESQTQEHRGESGADPHESATRAVPAGSPEAAVEGFLTALSSGRGDEAQRWLAPDVLVYESGGKESSRDEYASHHLRADMEFLAQARVQQLERTAHGVGDVAWVTSRSRMYGEIEGDPLELISTETMVLTREAEGWRIRHIHWSSARSDREGG